MEVKFEIPKYKILGTASILGASNEHLEKIDEYMKDHDILDLDLLKCDDNDYKDLANAMSSIVVAQIAKNLNL